MLGGDTDTNCAIVGGVVGAYAGVDNIDPIKLRKVLECHLEEGMSFSSSRANFIQPALGCIDEMLTLVEIAPSALK